MPAAECLGAELPAFTVVVDRERVRRFAAAIGEGDAVHHDVAAARAAGYPDLLVPPTHLFGLDLEFGNAVGKLTDAGISPAQCLHVEQEFTYYSPVYAGETLVFYPRFVEPSLRKHGSMEFIARETTVKRADGERVALMRQVVAVRHVEETA